VKKKKNAGLKVVGDKRESKTTREPREIEVPFKFFKKKALPDASAR
jgi:hypothetical protein